jgi:spermidine/putrescine transport system ATP-binding protein
MIAGFIQPSAGDIRLDGETIVGLPPHRRPINMVFQNYALFPHLSVGRNVAFGMEVRQVPAGERVARVQRVLSAVELDGFEERSVSELSGGQQQRVALARALVLHPRVLLLDEPLGALDQKVRRKMQLELMRIHREVGITFVHVTHDQEEALAMSDRIAVMRDGRVEQLGDRVEVYTQPSTPFVASFVGESNRFAGIVQRASGDKFSLRIDGKLLVPLPNSEHGGVGQPAEIFIRPEHVVISPTDETGMVMFEGTLRDLVFLGEFARCHVNLPEGVEIVASAPAHLISAGVLKNGTQIRLGWPIEASIVFPRAAA